MILLNSISVHQNAVLTSKSLSSPKHIISKQLKKNNNSNEFNNFCSCGRRHFIGLSATSLLPILPSNSLDFLSDSKIAGYKDKLFSNLRGNCKEVLELGIGTGPNLKYYGGDAGIRVIGVDPNRKMEKYAKAASVEAGLPLTRFYFKQAVGEALPISDASMDAVVGTLVLCSVKDAKRTLKEVKRVLKPGGLYVFIEHVAAQDGTTLRFIQNVADPLQQIVADGCHLTRDTGTYISEAGFSDVNLKVVSLSTSSLINPHVYGTAFK